MAGDCAGNTDCSNSNYQSVRGGNNMTEQIEGIEYRNRGGTIEVRTEKGWKLATDKHAIQEMEARARNDIIDRNPCMYGMARGQKI